jgi:ankyrin repeat protein
MRGENEVVKLLIEAGGVVDVRATGLKSLRMTPLTWCAYGGHDEAVATILAAGADPNLVVDQEQVC